MDCTLCSRKNCASCVFARRFIDASMEYLHTYAECVVESKSRIIGRQNHG